MKISKLDNIHKLVLAKFMLYLKNQLLEENFNSYSVSISVIHKYITRIKH